MAWYIGIDGGGTKTAFALGREDGMAVYRLQRTGCSYQRIGPLAVASLIREGVDALLEQAGVDATQVAGCCIGLPCYGESRKMDAYMEQTLAECLAPMPLRLVNDSVVGWAGSLECGEGIHLVAGTGSIAFGHGCDGTSLRSGGWCEFFGDEGSCYWIGRAAMGLFSKQADGRMPKGPLYHLVCANYEIDNPFEMMEIILANIAPHRERVAAFQLFAEKAALAGDTAVVKLYQQAADELVLLVQALREQLTWSTNVVTVSYYGGLFRAGELILAPLRQRLAENQCRLQPPMHTADEGALFLAIEQVRQGEK
ncbi:MAG: ATPase [Clostridia bacterium]|nr:ATPase [Clostridia bacterium]